MVAGGGLARGLSGARFDGLPPRGPLVVDVHTCGTARGHRVMALARDGSTWALATTRRESRQDGRSRREAGRTALCRRRIAVQAGTGLLAEIRLAHQHHPGVAADPDR